MKFQYKILPKLIGRGSKQREALRTITETVTGIVRGSKDVTRFTTLNGHSHDRTVDGIAHLHLDLDHELDLDDGTTVRGMNEEH